MSTSTSTSPSSSSTTPTNPPEGRFDPRVSNLNYLFLIIGFALIVAVVSYLWISRRKRQKKAEQRRQAANALARDVANFPDSSRSRWDYGAWRNGFRSNGAVHAMEEGLDERGEAPPPYKLDDKPPSTNVSTPLSAREHGDTPGGSASPPQIPLRNLAGHLPPDYHEGHDTTSEGSGGLYTSETVTEPGAALTFASERMSEVDQEMYRNAPSRMRQSSLRSGQGHWPSTRRLTSDHRNSA